MLKSLFWIGATGVALIAGIALHHGDDIERGVREGAAHIEANVEHWEGIGDHFEREIDLAEEAVDNGADAEESYEEAIASALVSSGLFTLENIEDIEATDNQSIMTVDNDTDVHVSDIVERARAKLEAARDSGEPLPEGQGLDADDINDVIEALDDLGAFEGNGRIRIQ